MMRKQLIAFATIASLTFGQVAVTEAAIQQPRTFDPNFDHASFRQMAADHSARVQLIDGYVDYILNVKKWDERGIDKIQYLSVVERQALKNRSANCYNDALNDALQWRDTIKPRYKTTVETTIKNIGAIQQNNRDALAHIRADHGGNTSRELNDSLVLIGKQQQTIDAMIRFFMDYRTKTQASKGKYDSLEVELHAIQTGEKTKRQSVVNEIEALQTELKSRSFQHLRDFQHMKTFWQGFVFGLTIPVSGTLVLLEKKEYDKKQKVLHDRIVQLSDEDEALATLNVMINQVQVYADDVDAIILSLEALKTEWLDVASKYETLSRQVKDLTQNDYTEFLEAELVTMNETLTVVQQHTQELNNELNYQK